jgi:hypothetical protein
MSLSVRQTALIFWQQFIAGDFVTFRDPETTAFKTSFEVLVSLRKLAGFSHPHPRPTFPYIRQPAE